MRIPFIVKPKKDLTITGYVIRSAPRGSRGDDTVWSTALRFTKEEESEAIKQARELINAECNKELDIAVVPVGY